MGCQYGRFTLKTLLRLRHNHNLPSQVAFTNLVKTFGTSNHKLLIAILASYGAPPCFFSVIRRMYENSMVRIIIGKIDTYMPFKVGVKQVDSMDPFLFLFIIMSFSETLENNGQILVSQNPHSQVRATQLSLPAILSATNQNTSTQGISFNYSACCT